MSRETNPFRLSMYARSQSPEGDADYTRSSHNQSAPHARAHAPAAPAAPAVPPQPRLPRANPFRVDLSEQRVPSPPPYDDRDARVPEEKPRSSAADENYRRGLEEGMRLAKEKERQKRRERRRQHEEREHDKDKDRSRTHSRPVVSRSSSADDAEKRKAARSARRRAKAAQAKGTPGSLDVIDKMDVTGIYGSSRFHHDGPFDACAPHRNQAGARGVATPISAFPVDGPNNSLAVEDPAVSAYRTATQVYGRDTDSIPPEIAQSSFDPTDRGAKVHGERTFGLGSTTFIDGTPATNAAIEDAREQRAQNLGRSKSLFRPRAQTTELGEPKSLLSRVRSLRVSRH